MTENKDKRNKIPSISLERLDTSDVVNRGWSTSV
jgi:hypothetical protein